MKKFFYTLMGVIALLSMASGMFPQTAEEKLRAQRDTQQQVRLIRAEQAVKSVLRDPRSATFGTSFIGRDDAVCGVVNAKNGFGGYTGPQTYMVHQNELRLGATLPASLWNRYCAKRDL